MDIYSFIRSQDVAAHCRTIGKTWNTLEMAVIIDRSNRTIADKHAAWQELIDHYPDMPAMPNYHKIQFESVHKVMAERMDYERQAIKWFKTPENGVFYTYKLESWDSEAYPFATFEKAVADLKGLYSQSEAPKVYIQRVTVDECKHSGIYADIDYEGNLHSINAWASDEVRAKWFPNVTQNKCKAGIYEFEFADLFFIDIPFPFEQGDILTCTRYEKPEIFVLVCDCKDPKWLEWYARSLRGELSDGSDMQCWCHFVNDAGIIYTEHTGGYDTFEYFKGKLEGKYRILHYISLFMADEIRLDQLLHMQCRNVAEQLLGSNFNIDEHGCYIPEHLLCENYNRTDLQ